MGSMDGKVVVVTGAAGGIGRPTVSALKREGATVVGVDIYQADDTGADALIACDLVVEDQVRTLYADVFERYGRIDGLFNNAGVALPDDASVLEVSLAVFERTMQINVAGVMLCCKYGIPRLIASGGGSVVNTASAAATVGSAISQIGYTASKGAVVAMSREMAVEFARKGIRVNTLSPGPVRTPMLDALYVENPAWVARRMVHVPAGRFGTAEEVAETALFLLSDASRPVNGIDLLADGGISAAYVTPED